MLLLHLLADPAKSIDERKDVPHRYEHYHVVHYRILALLEL